MTLNTQALADQLQQVLGSSIVRLKQDLGEVTIDVAAADYCAAALKLRDTAGLCFDQLIDLCGMAMKTGSITIDATSAESGDNVSDLAATVDGPDITIWFNAKYMMDVLIQIDTPQVAIETTKPTRPGTLRPVDGVDFLHNLMPMATL